MNIEELIVLLPCHSLEDFPVHHEGDEAEGLMAAWSGLWHPALIAACGQVPVWFRADAPPEKLKNRVVVIPQVSDPLLLPGWPTRAKAEGARLIRKTPQRAKVTATALELLDTPPTVPDDLAADFFALGTGFLMVELLTRQMRYMSNLDEVRFGTEAVAAARAAVEGREDDARQNLKNAFETLYEGRERFYPVDNYLIDLTLTAETTLGPSLVRQLQSEVPFNLLLSGRLVERLATTAPTTFAALQHALDRRTASIVGGDFDERETALLPAEMVRRELVRGLDAYRTHLGRTPEAYGRRLQGLTPLLPGLLSHAGFSGTLGFTLDEGVFPTPDQAKVRWEGLDSAAVDCLCRVPLDAAKPETFLDLPRKIGESMDRDYVATTVFAHWPGAASPYFDDLRRMAAYAPVLGKFITLADYFEHTERPGQISKHLPDRYRSTHFRQAVVRNLPNPISWIADAHRRRLLAESSAALQLMTESVTLRRAATDAAALLNELDDRTTLGLEAGPAVTLDLRCADLAIDAAKETAAALTGKTPTAGGGSAGLLLLNTQAVSRRELVEVASLSALPAVEGAVSAVQESGEQGPDMRRHAVVQVPAMGFAWISPAATPAAKPRRPPKSIVLENSLNTDLFNLQVSPKTGGIQGVFATNVRGNRLSQQLAFRFPGERAKPGDVWRDPDLDPTYTTMVCDSIEPTITGPVVGELTSRGRLIDPDERVLARFTQRVRAVQGLPLATVDIELEIDEHPRADPWGSYYAARFAWVGDDVTLARSVYQTHHESTAKRLESPAYVELNTFSTRTLILTDGFPFHVRTGTRMLDTLLIARNEERRRFRFGIVLDSNHPAQDAAAFMSPLHAVENAAAPASGQTGRLFFIDAKNVIATHWESMIESDRVVGFRARIMETEGRGGRIELHSPRKILSARQVDLHGATLVDIPAGDDRIACDIAAYEWIEIEARY